MMQDIVIIVVIASLVASFASLITTLRQLRQARTGLKDRHEFRITIVNERGEPVLSTEFAGSEEDVKRLGRQVTRAQESA